MKHTVLHLGNYKPESEWARPGKPEWPDHITVRMTRRQAIKHLGEVVRQLEGDDPTLGVVLLGRLEGEPSNPAEREEGEEEFKDNQIAHKILTTFYLYEGYPVKSRGPSGLLLDALRLVRPDLAVRISEGEEVDEVIKELQDDTGEFVG